jgi:hypothetical protein
MNHRSKIYLILLLLTSVIIVSCNRGEEFSEIPSIEYQGFAAIYNPELQIYDRGVIYVKYTDGDGDIGLAQGDTLPPYNPGSRYYYNFIITYYELQNGVVQEVPLLSYNPSTQEYDTVSLSARVPVLTPDGRNKAIKGTIQDTIFIYNFNSDYDTVRFSAILVDRALNESNEVFTPFVIRQ